MTMKTIANEEEYEAALVEIRRLWDAPPDTTEQRRLDELSNLVESYEDDHYALPPPNPISEIKYLLERQQILVEELEIYRGGKNWLIRLIGQFVSPRIKWQISKLMEQFDSLKTISETVKQDSRETIKFYLHLITRLNSPQNFVLDFLSFLVAFIPIFGIPLLLIGSTSWNYVFILLFLVIGSSFLITPIFNTPYRFRWIPLVAITLTYGAGHEWLPIYFDGPSGELLQLSIVAGAWHILSLGIGLVLLKLTHWAFSALRNIPYPYTAFIAQQLLEILSLLENNPNRWFDLKFRRELLDKLQHLARIVNLVEPTQHKIPPTDSSSELAHHIALALNAPLTSFKSANNEYEQVLDRLADSLRHVTSDQWGNEEFLKLERVSAIQNWFPPMGWAIIALAIALNGLLALISRIDIPLNVSAGIFIVAFTVYTTYPIWSLRLPFGSNQQEISSSNPVYVLKEIAGLSS